MSQDQTPGSPGEQRRKEKTTLQNLNERLETVLGNIRRDNIKLARNIKDHEGDVRHAEDVVAITEEEQAKLDAEAKELLSKDSTMMKTKIMALHASSAVDAKIKSLGVIGQWDTGSAEVNTEVYAEISATLARKQVDCMKVAALKSHEESKATVFQNTVAIINGKTNSAESGLQKFNEELLSLEEHLSGVAARNLEAAQRVVNPEVEDAMQERSLIALDEKERKLQTELLRQLEQKAHELDEEKIRSFEGAPSGVLPLNTPAKIDFIGDTAQLDNQYQQYETDRLAKDNEHKFVFSQRQQVRETLQLAAARVAAVKLELGEQRQQNTAMREEITSLHNDTNEDQRMQELKKKIAEVDAQSEVRFTKYTKAKQLVLNNISETESQFKNQIVLDAVLAEYEQIVRDYEEQYKVKRAPFKFEPPSSRISLPPVTSVPAFNAPPPTETPPPSRTTRKTQAQKSRGTAKGKGRTPARTGKSTPFPTTGDKDDDASMRDDDVGAGAARALAFSDEGMEVDTNNNNNNNNSASVSKKKRKEPPNTTAELEAASEEESASSSAPPPSGLKITEFKASTQRVKITNTSSTNVDLTRYRIRNCDYNVSQNLPNLTLPPGEVLTIGPRPRSSSSKSAKFQMYWQEGEFGHFEKNTKGVRLMGLNSEFVDEAK